MADTQWRRAFEAVLQTHADSGSTTQHLQNPSVLRPAGKLQIQLGRGARCWRPRPQRVQLTRHIQHWSVLRPAGKLQIRLGEGRALVLSKDPEARQLHASGAGGDASFALAEESSGVLQTSGTEGPR